MLFVSRLTRRGTSVTRLPLLMLNTESPQTLWLTRLSSLPELRLVESNSLTLTLQEEQEHCTTIKSTAVTIYFELAEKGCAFITNPEQREPTEKVFSINLISSSDENLIVNIFHSF